MRTCAGWAPSVAVTSAAAAAAAQSESAPATKRPRQSRATERQMEGLPLYRDLPPTPFG